MRNFFIFAHKSVVVATAATNLAISSFTDTTQGVANSVFSSVQNAYTLPAAPSGLTCTVPAGLNGQTNIQLTWTDNSHAESNFYIEFSTDSGSNWAHLVDPAADAVYVQHASLTPNTRYDYRIKSVQGAAVSAWSNVAYATTNKTVLQKTEGLQYSYGGLPCGGGGVVGGVTDAEMLNMQYSYGGLPCGTWTNLTS